MSDWISIDDERKPEKGDVVPVLSNNVLLYASYTGENFVYFFPISVFGYAMTNFEELEMQKIQVTHWMPILFP